ncbi:MAG TPA: OmpA family protein [Kofleriaceae bacterium]|nr:OmpA family protein [Kofleriaceae bacterium]
MRSMRPLVTPVLVFLALGGLGAGKADAQEARPRALGVEIGVFGGVFIPDEHHEFYNPAVAEQQPLANVSPDFGARLGFYPLSFVGLEGEAGASFSEADSGESANLYSLRGSLVLQVPLRVTPFIMGGVGNTWLRSENTTLGNDRDRVWHGAAGLKIFANRTLQFRLEGRIYYTNQERNAQDPTDDNGMVAHFGALAGVTWVIGGRGAPAVEAQPDPDGDGFVEPEDLCPNEKGVEPDGCPAKDKDGDGINDSGDRCPTEAETVNGVDDTDGCPDELPDPDADGVRGPADKCPAEPEDKDGFEDEDGCPDVDNDKDGLVDGSDMCPEQAGPPENRGCPDTDKDGDGVVDRIDNCPDEVGRAEFQGCRTRQLISITASQLKVFQNVQFRTGKASIAPRSRRLLTNVADVVRAHPEFRKIRIEGHTDDRGADDFNKSLSQDRARAVVDFLVGQGVESDRLEAIGFGEERPLASNRSANGRRKNRRVEFNLEDVRPSGSAGPRGGTPAPAPTPTPTKAPAPAAGEKKPAAPAPAAKPSSTKPAPVKPAPKGGGGQ